MILKYNLDLLCGGISVERALEIFLSSCNKRDTVFITEQWIGPRLARLRQLLADPISKEEAQAMRDTVMKNGRLDDMIEWLAGRQLSWPAFNNGKKWLREEEQRLREEEREKRFEQLEKEAKEEEESLRKRGIAYWQSQMSDEKLQSAHPPDSSKAQYLSTAQACARCGAKPEQLVWFWFSTPAITWARLFGRAGWMTACPKCNIQIDFFVVMMN